MKNLPNILTGLRIAMIPFLVWQMLAGNALNAGLILIASGVTDTLDGYLARRFNWVSDLGKILDPIADKFTQTAVSICLLVRIPNLWYFFAFLIFKDSVMLTLGGYLTRSGVKIEGAGIFGKVATVVFYVVMILILIIPDIPDWVVCSMVAIDAIFALMAALSYIPDFHRYLAQRQTQEK